MSKRTSISGSQAKDKTKSSQSELKWITTRILDDVFTDEVSLFKPHFDVDYDAYLQRLWDSNDEIHDLLKQVESLEDARTRLYQYLEVAERKVFKEKCLRLTTTFISWKSQR
jgi:lysine 2,3-aminomutase